MVCEWREPVTPGQGESLLSMAPAPPVELTRSAGAPARTPREVTGMRSRFERGTRTAAQIEIAAGKTGIEGVAPGVASLLVEGEGGAAV